MTINWEVFKIREAVLRFICASDGVSMTQLVNEFHHRGISERVTRSAAQHLIECGPITVDDKMRLHIPSELDLTTYITNVLFKRTRNLRS